jgi:ATP-dependent RNA helicase DDX41
MSSCSSRASAPVSVVLATPDTHSCATARAGEIHGALAQEERTAAIDAFKSGRADVLVASDIASKGLDFPLVHHVVCFDLPSVDTYVHRIGRTGRGKNKGMATTFVDRATDESELADLAGLLREAKQQLPACLERFAAAQVEGCSYCGGLGHRMTACPKIATLGRKNAAQLRDALGGGAY